jgi:outer membrane protein assembly factor BamE (lipoprotein component of BamABCDE complex)
MSTFPRPSGLRRLLLISCLLVSSCGWLLPPAQLRGNKVDPESMKELTIGTSTKADVSAVIGSPTARDTFDDNTWLYITEMTRQPIGQTLGAIDQGVVVLKFDDKGVLKSIDKLNKGDSVSAPMIARTTASPGTEASFMQQLLGNIGRFNPTGGMSNSNSAPGGGAPTSGLGSLQ